MSVYNDNSESIIDNIYKILNLVSMTLTILQIYWNHRDMHSINYQQCGA